MNLQQSFLKTVSVGAVIFACSVVFCSCEQKSRLTNSTATSDKIITSKKDTDLNEKRPTTSILDISLDTLPISALPLGYPTLFNDSSPKIDSVFYGELWEKLREPYYALTPIEEPQRKKLLSVSYKPMDDYTYDLDYPVVLKEENSNYEKQDKYFSYSGRLPKVGNVNVVIFENYSTSWFENNDVYDLVTLDSSGQVIDRLNINHVRGFDSDIESYSVMKYFFIDKNYIIHLKYTKSYSENLYQIKFYVKYKVLSNGRIVRWFDEQDKVIEYGFERGEVRNHVKEGKWSTYYGIGDGMNATTAYYRNGVPADSIIEIYTLSPNGTTPGKLRLSIDPVTGKRL